MPRTHILIVEDEQSIREMVAFALEDQGYQVSEAADMASAWQALTERTPHLILLDWMLPDVSGIELLRKIRRNDSLSGIPVIMLTARGEEADRVRGFEHGADDYVVKPFSTKELMARVQAVLRRASPHMSEEPARVGDLVLDPVSHRTTMNGEVLELGPTEFRLLHFFMTHPERVYSRGQLLDSVWGNNVYVEERTVDVHIRRLRRALEPGGYDACIQTVRGAGYRFSAQPS